MEHFFYYWSSFIKLVFHACTVRLAISSTWPQNLTFFHPEIHFTSRKLQTTAYYRWYHCPLAEYCVKLFYSTSKRDFHLSRQPPSMQLHLQVLQLNWRSLQFGSKPKLFGFGIRLRQTITFYSTISLSSFVLPYRHSSKVISSAGRPRSMRRCWLIEWQDPFSPPQSLKAVATKMPSWGSVIARCK